MDDIKSMLKHKLDAIEQYNSGKLSFWRLPQGSLMFRTVHNLLGKGFSASDVDLALIDEQCDYGIIAFIEHKHSGESISSTQKKLFHALVEDGYEVYIIVSYSQYSSFDVRQWQSDDTLAAIDYKLTLEELGAWELELRKEYCQKKGYKYYG